VIGDSFRGSGSIIVVLFLTACTTTLTCPPVEGPSRAVFVLDHGRHASLVIENDRGFLHRYTYGERRWYAENDTGYWRALGAGFRKTEGVLGRREIHTAATADAVAAGIREGVVSVHEFTVSTERADALILELDGLFFEGTSALVYNDLYDLEFAPHPRPYTAWHNSNHEVADWMRALDCTVNGTALRSDWRTGD
jgi:hypothetical protein